ncbi:MAG: hypothetical protein HYS05_12465 [Acidobacteria bacterium]|nr:hypothetical protein [Acidobacteriota bacterium]
MAYMQITCLEMEKARKGKEKESALQRLQTLDARLCQIEAEKAALVRALAEHGAARAAARANGGSQPAPAPVASGIKLRY